MVSRANQRFLVKAHASSPPPTTVHQQTIYCPHPKDGEGNVFSLSHHPGWGGGTPTPKYFQPLVSCPFQRCTPVPGPMSIPGEYPDPGRGYPSPRWGGYSTPRGIPQDRDSPWSGSLSQDLGTPLPLTNKGLGYLSPSQDYSTPTPWDRLCLDRLCCGQYASCRFPQEDCLVTTCI